MAVHPDSIGFVYEADLLRIVNIPRSTRQHWAQVGLVEQPRDGRYREAQVVETAIVGQLLRVFRSARDVRRIWQEHRGDVLSAVLGETTEDIVLLVEGRALRLMIARSSDRLARVVRPLEAVVMFPIGSVAKEAREDFWRFAATTDERSDMRRRGDARRSRGLGPDQAKA